MGAEHGGHDERQSKFPHDDPHRLICTFGNRLAFDRPKERNDLAQRSPGLMEDGRGSRHRRSIRPIQFLVGSTINSE